MGELPVRICIPVIEDKGLESAVSSHFGSAPLFMIVDTADGDCRAIPNGNQHHGHGMCMPLASLQGESIEAMVVGGIGTGALNKLMAAGVRVHLSEDATVRGVVDALKAGTLRLMQPDLACGHHEHRGH
jgi:predicted Fe-Mo cluster-binding NifX family protein